MAKRAVSMSLLMTNRSVNMPTDDILAVGEMYTQWKQLYIHYGSLIPVYNSTKNAECGRKPHGARTHRS